MLNEQFCRLFSRRRFDQCDARIADVAEKKKLGRVDKPLIKPEIKSDLPKVIAFGDSLTAGFGLTEKESYPYLLQKKLESDGYKYEVINAGVSGDTSLGGLERVDWVLEQEKAEILILELGANDLLRGVPVKIMKNNLEKIIQKAPAKTKIAPTSKTRHDHFFSSKDLSSL